MTQEDIPSNILILSDMEFDYCAEANYGRSLDKRLFDVISDKYKEAGYKLPRLVFWNIYSTSNTIPVIENNLGVALVSGYSPAISDMVLSEEVDPYKLILNKLNTERYEMLSNLLQYI